MANNRQYRRKMHQKVDSMSSSFSSEFSKVIKILFVIILVLVIFYFLTVYILEKGDDTSTVINTTPSEADIQYQEILAGNSFSMKDDHYYVLYYEMSSDNLKSIYTNIITTYEDKENHDSIYTVDMSSAFNNKFISDISNPKVNKIDELKIAEPTLIEFEDGNVINYIEGEDLIKNELS